MDSDMEMVDAPCSTSKGSHAVGNEDRNEGYISDESSFYGDEDLRADLERRVSEFDPATYWSTVHLSLASIAAANLAAKPPPASLTKPLYNPHKGNLNGRQLSESIPEFLSRLPPLTTPFSSIGPWIWIANPYSDDRPLSHDLAGFMAKGEAILAAFSAAITAQEAEMKGLPHSNLSRQLAPMRKRVTEDILAAAKQHAVTSGKWMMFPSPDDVNAAWRLVADATASGQLGSGAKVATDAGHDRARLICVYTPDFADLDDVRRVLGKLEGMGLVHTRGPWGEKRGIYYKCDAFTHLGIESRNRWDLKASLYASRELLSAPEHGK